MNIELKLAEQYQEDFGIDVAERLFNILKARNLHTVFDGADVLPVIIQSFDLSALEYFKTVSTLPTCLLHNFPPMNHQKQWTPQSIKETNAVDIIGPDWRYLNSPLRKSEDYP